MALVLLMLHHCCSAQGGTTNICYNALDRHVKAGHGATPCLLFEGNDVGHEKALSYAETLEEVCKLVS